jgi:hypothetical protein
MEKEEWLKAIKCTKEELIEWLNEMYEDDKRLKEIIEKYEKSYNVGIKEVEKTEPDFIEPWRERSTYYTKVKAKNFEYIKNW